MLKRTPPALLLEVPFSKGEYSYESLTRIAGRSNSIPSTLYLLTGNNTGFVIGMIPSFVDITVSSLFVPVMEGFQQNA